MNEHASTELRRVPVTARRRGWAALTANLRVPLYRDGNALVLNSALTALLGAAYWLLAARDYRPHDVGVNTAAISAMMFLAGVAQLNLMSALVRFVPILRGARGRFIAACYLVAAVAAVGCAAVFLLGLHWWAPALGVLGTSPGLVAWFVAATVAWCVFNLQDSALTGIGAAVLVPVENFAYGIAKILLLVALLQFSPRFGIFGSWTAGLLVTILPVNLLIFGALLRRRAAAPDAAVKAPTRSEIVRFVGPDYLGALFWLAATTLMPVIVVAIAGPTTNAYFSLAWMIVVPVEAISASMGVALVAAAAGDPRRLPEFACKVLSRTARLTVPAGVILAIAAPYVMEVFGRRYATHGAVTLSLLALSMIPNTVTALYTSVYRVQRRMRAVVALQAGLCGSVLLLAPLLLLAMGIAGVGLAWLVCQSVVAVALLTVDPVAIKPGSRKPLDVAGDLCARVTSRALKACRLPRRSAGELARCLTTGTVLSSVEVLDDVVVGRARAPRQSDSVYVKLARSAGRDARLDRAGDGLIRLRAEPRLRQWDVERPQIIARGQLDGRRFVVESALSGVTMAQLLARGAQGQPLVGEATAAIEGLHRCTAELVVVDSQLLERWIYAPARAVEGLVARTPRRVAALGELSGELAALLRDQKLHAGFIHGDFTPGNVLFDEEGSTVTGVIDWELMAISDLPAIDRATMLLATETQITRRQLGDVVAAITIGRAPAALHDSLTRAAGIDPCQPLDARALALLYWLRHAAARALYYKRSARERVWQHYNVDRVLDAWEPR
jgi:O-antigen/teichoic acid export membrane protein/aminoglycoside phosphotransferase